MEMNQYLSIFIDEANEHLQALNDNMLRLEQQPDDTSIVQDIFRSAHTLKGMSATMGFEDLASLTHEMENVLDLLRNNKLRMSERIFDVQFKCLDVLEGMVQDVINGGSGQADVSELVDQLKAIVKGDEQPNEASDASQVSEAMSLDQYQMSILSQSLDIGQFAYHVEVVVREDCLLKAARAYMVFDVLERNGEVIKSFPPVQEIEQEKFNRSFSVYLISQTEQANLHSQLSKISEIDAVHIIALDQAAIAQIGDAQSVITQDLSAAKLEIAATTEMKAEPEVSVQTSSPQSVPAARATDAAADKAKPVANGGGAASHRTIRVDIERLDTLMNLFSELLIDRVRLEQLASEIRRNDLSETVEHMTRVSVDLQNIVLKLRMVPVESVFNRFPRMVRDLAKTLDKKVDFIITGAETELDRTVIDEIGDPLVHLLRNAVDHGVESIEERLKAGKPETGTVYLRAYHSGNHVMIEIEEDGRGINQQKIKETAVKRGILSADEASRMSDDEANMLIFAPGFSTADKVSDISGRGVGLDVVKSKINSLGGHVSIRSKLGSGTLFSIQLPLTLSIIAAMLVKLGTEKYAVPLASIMETGIVKRSEIKSVHGTQVLEYRNAIIPVISLARVMEASSYNDEQEAETEMLIIRKGDKLAAVLVDDLLGQQEIVLKPLGKYLNGVTGEISGATILGDGQVALIIDTNALIK